MQSMAKSTIRGCLSRMKGLLWPKCPCLQCKLPKSSQTSMLHSMQRRRLGTTALHCAHGPWHKVSIQLIVQANQLLGFLWWLPWHIQSSHAAGGPISNALVWPLTWLGTYSSASHLHKLPCRLNHIRHLRGEAALLQKERDPTDGDQRAHRTSDLASATAACRAEQGSSSPQLVQRTASGSAAAATSACHRHLPAKTCHRSNPFLLCLGSSCRAADAGTVG